MKLTRMEDTHMDYTRLKKNIFDVIKEQQIKLGYRKEAVRLYYPLESLNRLLGTDLDEDEMKSALKTFTENVKDELGTINISNENKRFCIFLPEEVSEFILTHTEQKGFLYDFIETVSKHNVTIDDITLQFKKYSDHVHFEKINNGEFDYLIYFENGEPDDYRYCLTDEGEHIIYHRFTIEDYNDIYGNK